MVVFHSYGGAKQTKRNQLSFFFSFILIFSVTEDGKLLKLMVNTNANLPLRGDSDLALFSFTSVFFLKACAASVCDRVLIIDLSQQTSALSSTVSMDLGLLVVDKTLARAKSDALVNKLTV